MTPDVQATLRRLAAFAVSTAVIALNKKLGLNLGTPEIAAISTLALGYIGQSVLKSVQSLQPVDNPLAAAPPQDRPAAGQPVKP